MTWKNHDPRWRARGIYLEAEEALIYFGLLLLVGFAVGMGVSLLVR